MFNKLITFNTRACYLIHTQVRQCQQKYAIKEIQDSDLNVSTMKILGTNQKPLSIHKRKEKPKIEEIQNVVLDEEGNFVYTKMKNHDTRVAEILTPVKSKIHRKKRNLMMLEGKRLIQDALQAGCTLSHILFSRKDEVEYLKPYLPKLNAKLFKMPYKEIQMWSDLVTSPGIIGLFKIPEDTSQYRTNSNFPLTVICDNIRDPSNLGAVLRTCGGVGCQTVLLTKGCADVWDSKVLRSAAGCHFKLHIEHHQTWEEIKDSIEEDSIVVVADNNRSSQTDLNSSSLPLHPYWDFTFCLEKKVALIVGGETEGISPESYKLASEYGGVRLNIPLDNNVDSLNTNTALAVLAFEIKRQINALAAGNT